MSSPISPEGNDLLDEKRDWFRNEVENGDELSSDGDLSSIEEHPSNENIVDIVQKWRPLCYTMDQAQFISYLKIVHPWWIDVNEKYLQECLDEHDLRESPSDETLLDIVKTTREQFPGVGRPELLTILRHNIVFPLTDDRLKECLESHNLAATPNDDELLKAITKLRPLHPHLGRAAFRTLLKTSYTWTLSDARLKNLLDRDRYLQATPDGSGSIDEIIRQTFSDYRIRERKFFLGLSKEKVLKISIGLSDKPIFPACSFRHHFEILLVLRGRKPCVLIGDRRAQEIYDELVEHCVKPMMRPEHGRYRLEQYGFHLQKCTNDIKIPDRLRKDFGDGWVFADKQSKQWRLVENLFLKPNSGEFSEHDLRLALGHPGISGSKDFKVMDNTERNLLVKELNLQGEGVPDVRAYDFTCPVETADYEDIMTHFFECQSEANKVGMVLATQDWPKRKLT